MVLVKIKEDRTRRCKDGFLAEYLKYTQYQESPSDFHLWVGLSLLSSAIERKCFLDRMYFRIYPNIYMVLVAESGALHKSTALGMGYRIFREAIPSHPFFAQKGSPEALIGFLKDNTEKTGRAPVTIYSSEFSVFFGRSNLDPQLLYLLTDLYDCPDYHAYSTVGRGLEEVEKVYPTIWAGTTPQWIKTSLPEDSVGGGFTSRIMWVYRTESDKEKVAMPERIQDPNIMEWKSNCIHDLKLINNLKGDVAWDKAAQDYYESWYNLHRVDQAPAGLRGHYARKGDYMIKLAILLSVDRDDRMVIKAEHLELARKLIVDNEETMVEVMRKMAQSETGKKIDYIRNLIEREGSIPHSRLMRNANHKVNAEELSIILRTLESAGEIDVELTVGGRGKVYTFLGSRGDCI